MAYRKNKYRKDVIDRFGPETGLPLFSFPAAGGTQDDGKNHKVLRRFETAPKAMEVATETRKISHIMLTFDAASLGAKQQAVYEVLERVAHPDNYEVEERLRAWRAGVLEKLESLSNEEIAKFLELPINRVVGRTFELRQIGLVTAARKRVCLVTGRVVMTWRVTSQEEQLKIKNSK